MARQVRPWLGKPENDRAPLSACDRQGTSQLREFIRPWKLLTLGVGIGLLIAGALLEGAPDWDIPISLIMATVAYLSAPWSMRVIVGRRCK